MPLKIIPFAARDQLTTIPIVAGFAVMIKLMKRWWQKQKETEQLLLEKSKAELQVLKAQVHPHFLFNTLNNIYFFILTHSAQGSVMIQKLRALLQYLLTECNQPLVSLEKEISFIKDYLELERIRYGETIEMDINIQTEKQYGSGPPLGVGGEGGRMLSPLLLIPLIENSFKHGASKMIANPWVKMDIRTENDRLFFSISNSLPPKVDMVAGTNNKSNIGLNNVRKRLQLLYPNEHELRIQDEQECFSVHLEIPLSESGISEKW